MLRLEREGKFHACLRPLRSMGCEAALCRPGVLLKASDGLGHRGDRIFSGVLRGSLAR